MKQLNFLTTTALLAAIVTIAFAGTLNWLPVAQSNSQKDSKGEVRTETKNYFKLTTRNKDSHCLRKAPNQCC